MRLRIALVARKRPGSDEGAALAAAVDFPFVGASIRRTAAAAAPCAPGV